MTNEQNRRRAFLAKAAAVGALGAAASAAGFSKIASEPDGNGVVVGRAKKKEVLYHKTAHWEKFYKIAY